MSNTHINHLASLSLDGSGKRREPPIAVEDRPEGYDAAFDADTLWYDAVQVDDEVHIVMPRLLNLRHAVNDGSLMLDGARAKPLGRRIGRRHEIQTLAAPNPASRASVRIGRWIGETAVHPDQSDLFAGLNASVQLNRNNDLRWIVDWARYHVSAHGLQAMLVVDNGSDAYPPEAILEALAPVGLDQIVVLCAPLPYGPPRSGKTSAEGKYLQSGMLNVARLRFLRRARAVLVADIDELVWAKSGSVFDAAARSFLGYVSFKGTWREPDPEAALPWTHGDHRFPGTFNGPCPTKYCIVPGGRLGRLSWDVHRPERALLPSRLTRRDLGYWHCRGVTTNWKAYDRAKPRPLEPEDPEITQALARHLG